MHFGLLAQIYKGIGTMKKQKKWLIKNFILFLMGYCIYLAIEVTFRGFSFRLMGIVGGLSMIGLSEISETFHNTEQLPPKMLMGAAVITCLELISGTFALFVLDIRMWDYSELWMNSLDGLICPLFSVFWFFLSGIGIIVADGLDYYLFEEGKRPAYRIGRWTFSLPAKQA